MAIEIIEKGRTLGPKYRNECSLCECVFSFHEEDVVKREIVFEGFYYTVKCPHCGADCAIYITQKDIEKMWDEEQERQKIEASGL